MHGVDSRRAEDPSATSLGDDSVFRGCSSSYWQPRGSPFAAYQPAGSNLSTCLVTWTRGQRLGSSSSLHRARSSASLGCSGSLAEAKERRTRLRPVRGQSAGNGWPPTAMGGRWRTAIQTYRGADHDGLAEVSSADGGAIDGPSNRSPSR